MQTVGTQLLMPSIVCSAFCLELYFKALIVIEKGGVAPRGHDLQFLFSCVSKTNQMKIRAFFNQRTRVNAARIAQFAAAEKAAGIASKPWTFDNVLAASKRAFEKLRYAYQKDLQSGEGWMANDIKDGTRAIILALHPDWA